MTAGLCDLSDPLLDRDLLGDLTGTGRFCGDSFFLFLLKKHRPFTAVGYLQPPSVAHHPTAVTLPPPSVTIQLPSVTLQPPLVPLQCA